MKKNLLILILYSIVLFGIVCYIFDQNEKSYADKIEMIEKNYNHERDSLNTIIEINLNKIDSMSKLNNGLTHSIDSIKNKTRKNEPIYKNFNELDSDDIVNLFDSISTSRTFKKSK
jgi:uncharacterized protein Yka (UPF0111/DUF47 family)